MERSRKVYTDRISVTERLYSLGLKEDDLRTSVEFGQQQAALCTENEPHTSAGFTAWSKSTRMLREILLPKGWTCGHAQGYETTIDPSGTSALAATGGDFKTGNPHVTPSTRSAKGPATKAAISENQDSFFDWKPEAFGPLPVAPERRIRQTWILLYFFDEEAGIIHSELSLPTDMSVDGYVGSWRERIILKEIPFGSDGTRINVTPRLDPDKDTGAIDIEISRKSGTSGKY